MINDPSERWRAVIAVLANPTTRPILGTLLRGDDPAADLAALSPARRRSAVRALISAGVAAERGDSLELVANSFESLLRSASTPRATGVDRFLREGRIDRWPSASRDRDALLAWAIERALPPAESVDESTITGRLAGLTADPVGLRRALVDAGLLAREPDGSSYRRAR